MIGHVVGHVVVMIGDVVIEGTCICQRSALRNETLNRFTSLLTGALSHACTFQNPPKLIATMPPNGRASEAKGL